MVGVSRELAPTLPSLSNVMDMEQITVFVISLNQASSLSSSYVKLLFINLYDANRMNLFCAASTDATSINLSVPSHSITTN